ncbi:MAG: LemA family protein [Actinomycetota bacterium]
MIVLWIVLGVVGLLLIAGIISFNRFVSQRNLIRNAWANIDTELRRRYDLIPNLVESVKGYAAHEREVFEEVARTRSMAAAATGSPQQQAAAEGPFVAALGRLFAVAENYPQLQANQNFLALQQELANTEDRIQTSRRFYNNNVQDYNRRIQQFPSMIVARLGNFKEEEFFEVEEAIRQAGAPRVDFGAGAAGAAPAAGAAAPAGGGTPPAGSPPPAQSPAPQSPPPAGGGGGGFTG